MHRGEQHSSFEPWCSPILRRLADEYLKGASLEALCAGIAVGRLKKKRSLIGHGVAIRGHGGLHGPEPPASDLLVAAYQGRLTVGQVAANFGTAHARVSAALRTVGVPIRDPRRGPPVEELVREYLAGNLTKDLAERYGSNGANSLGSA